MKLFPPTLFPISQPFGANAVDYYASTGLKGHPGTDFAAPWGAKVYNSVDCYCYATLSKNNPNPAFYRAVCTIVEDETGCYEVIYGHMNEIYAEAGKSYPVSVSLGTVGNTGQCYTGGLLVSNEEKLAGSHRGAHCHFQVRPLIKSKMGVRGDEQLHWLNDGNGILEVNGWNFFVLGYNNGFNGCIDPMQFVDDLGATIRAEVGVLNQTKDPAVRLTLVNLIIQQCRKILGI
jgi:murein DD-endopeptidase MepM/ murein hydrolase activator NlpD